MCFERLVVFTLNSLLKPSGNKNSSVFVVAIFLQVMRDPVINKSQGLSGGLNTVNRHRHTYGLLLRIPDFRYLVSETSETIFVVKEWKAQRHQFDSSTLICIYC